MAYELTMEGLFSYFSPETVEKIIELPLVKRHLSAHDYCKCKEYLLLPMGFVDDEDPKIGEPVHALLGFEVLEHELIDDTIQYLSVEKIQQAYLHFYGQYFWVFHSKIVALKETPEVPFEPLSLLLNLVSEKKLILHIQGAMALPLQAFTNAIIEQDFLLQEIASQLIYQAGKAQEYIGAIQHDDMKYKQTIVSLAFSVVRLGLGVFNVGELANVSASIMTLASSSFDHVQEKFASIVSDIQRLVINTQLLVLQDAEKALISTTSPQEITLRWVMYRARIFDSANKSIKHILDSCVNNDDFFRCVIRETICKHKELSQEMLLIHATQQASNYIAEIVKGLQLQVAKIRHIRTAVMSFEGSQNIASYFRKMCLINYTLQHEKSGATIESWLTKKLGHRLSFYFPEVVFQKKWSPTKLVHMFHDEIKYCKQTVTYKEYQNRKRNSAVVLGLFRNPPSVKQALFLNLEEQVPLLGDRLVHDLQHQTINFQHYLK